MTSDSDDDCFPREHDVIKTKKATYTVYKLLGKGGYGAVYELKRDDGVEFAMKCESTSARKKVLPMDCKVIQGAQKIKSIHFCKMEDQGRIDQRFNFLVMKLVGSNLWDLRVQRPASRFTLNTALKLAEQCLIAIEELHRVGYLHRDIKPGNFAMGRVGTKEEHTVFMLDFGLCRRYCESPEKDLRIPRTSASFRGTTRYASMAALMNKEQSRKDDIESWLYMIVEWTGGALPWRKERGADARGDVLRQKKLCREDPVHLERFLRFCPKREFYKIMQYVDSLTYVNIPDYRYVFFLIKHACKTHMVRPDEPLDWDLANKYYGPSQPPGDGRPAYFSDREQPVVGTPGTPTDNKTKTSKKSKKVSESKGSAKARASQEGEREVAAGEKNQSPPALGLDSKTALPGQFSAIKKTEKADHAPQPT